MSDIPRKRIELKQTWNDAKNYALDELRKREEITSPDLVKEMTEKFKFKNEGSAYGIINALIQHNQIHYALIGKGKRMLYYGPSKGQVVIIKEEGKDEPKVEDEAMAMQAVQSGKINIEEEELHIPVLPDKEKEHEPVFPNRPKEPIRKTDQTLNSIIKSVNRQTEVDRAVKDVTQKTIRTTLFAVEQEIEASMSIENRAKLTLTYRLAQASGYDLKDTIDIIEMIVALKNIK